MFKQHYDCLIAGLPDLIITEYPKGLTSLVFRNELEEILTRNDFLLVQQLFRENDHRNLLNMLLHRDFQFDQLGNYQEDYLIRQLAEPTDIAPHMKKLILEQKDLDPGQSPRDVENRLHELFYDEVAKSDNEFILEWFAFDRNLRNVVAIDSCNRFGYSVENQLVVDENREELKELFLKGRLEPERFADENLPWMEEVVRILNSGIGFSEKEKALDQVKWAFLDETTIFYYFTIEKILSFVLKLKMLDRWRELDDYTGKAFLKKLITELEMSYSTD